MKKILFLIPIFALLLAVPVACAGSFHMNVKGSGNISFFFIHSDGHGTIMQGYSGDGTVDYESTYTDGTLNTGINVVDSGGGIFGTVLNPVNTWTASASYSDYPDVGEEETGKVVFKHPWGSSFNGGGSYIIN